MNRISTFLALHGLALAAVAFATGCAASLVYDPSIHPPATPLPNGAVQLVAEGGLLTQTRPAAEGKAFRPGAAVKLRYAFSQKLTLGFTEWGTIVDSSFRGGTSVDAILPFGGTTSEYATAVLIRAALVMDNTSIEGWGASAGVGWWGSALGPVRPYAAAGGLFGFRSLKSDDPQWGYGVVGNLGITIELASHFDAGIEAAAVVQVNTFDDITHLIVTPSASLRWEF